MQSLEEKMKPASRKRKRESNGTFKPTPNWREFIKTYEAPSLKKFFVAIQHSGTVNDVNVFPIAAHGQERSSAVMTSLQKIPFPGTCRESMYVKNKFLTHSLN